MYLTKPPKIPVFLCKAMPVIPLVLAILATILCYYINDVLLPEKLKKITGAPIFYGLIELIAFFSALYGVILGLISFFFPLFSGSGLILMSIACLVLAGEYHLIGIVPTLCLLTGAAASFHGNTPINKSKLIFMFVINIVVIIALLSALWYGHLSYIDITQN